MNLLQKIFLRLLYLTPFGYLLSVIYLIKGEKIPGISLSLESHSPIRAGVKRHPLLRERINWLVNGLFLFAEGIFAFKFDLDNNFSLAGGYAMFAFIFSLVSVVSAIFPNINWNKRRF